MAKLYYMLSVALLLLHIQGIFGAMNVTIGEIENNKLTPINNNGNSGNATITAYVCPSNNDFCVGRGDPNYIVPKSRGKEKIEGVFTDITTLDGFENNKQHLIVEACHPKQLEEGKCHSRKCAVNEDCLSDLCENGSCVINKQNPLMECKGDKGIMICLKYLQEPCIVSSECAGKCKDNVCTYRPETMLNSNPIFWYSTSILSILCLLLLFFCCCCCPGIFSCNVKEKRNNNNPGVVV